MASTTPDPAPPIAAELWDRFGALTLDDIPQDVRRLAGQCVLDWLGCALAGSREPLSGLLRDELAGPRGAVSLVGSPLRASVVHGALINGAAGHALDYDDTSFVGHPTAPVLPAVLAVAEERGLGGGEALAALVAGVEVEHRVQEAIGRDIGLHGWHTTSAMGVFGATAAVGRLLGLDRERFGHAFGLAASRSSGVKANFGTMTKPYHAGMAAEAGALSARLAARGYTANPRAIEANQGLAQAMGREARPARLAEVDGRWFLRGTLFKHHAACYLTHSTINSVREAMRGLRPEEVESLDLTVNPSILDVCGLYERPRTGLEAKFSLTGTAAMALHGVDTADPGAFVEEVVREPRLQETMERVSIATDRGMTAMQAGLTLRTKGGAIVTAEDDTGLPMADLDRQEELLLAKFEALAGGAGAVAERVLRLEEADSVREVLGGLESTANG